MAPDPLIVTLVLDAAAQERFDALRATHFPPERLLVGAHVTLFHALPSEIGTSVAQALADEAVTTPPLDVIVASVRCMGRGVAFELHSACLSALRGRLRQRWADRLTPQDRQGWRPHITIQNKVEPTVAKTLHAQLARSFTPYAIVATGLAWWYYRGGSWEAAGQYAFRGTASHT